MKNIRWIIQNNLIAENDLKEVQRACTEMGIEFTEVMVLPFSGELPKFSVDDNIENIYYGATSFINNVYHQFNKPKGIFFDEDKFSMENYLNIWGEHMLSSEAKITTFKEFWKEDHLDESLWFVRPDGDNKIFDGDVRSFGTIKTLIENSTKTDNLDFSEDTKIVVGPPYNIEKEWRNYIVDGKVVTSSLYRKNFRLNKNRYDAPEEMIKFVEDRCKEYMPHKIFAMDIALCGGDYYIIECGCLNSVGLYHSDIYKIVKSVSEYVLKNY